MTLPKGGVDHCANLRAVQTSGIRILFESEPNKNDCAGTRTQNMLVKSRLLYQLSYAISNEEWYRDLPFGFLGFFGNILGYPYLNEAFRSYQLKTFSKELLFRLSHFSNMY